MSAVTTVEAGIHPSVPMADYIRDPAPEPSVSKGVIGDLIELSEAHAYANHPRFGKTGDDSSTRSDLGSACHAVLLGGEEKITYCDATYVSGPRKGEIAADWTSKGARAFQNEARELGLIPMLENDRDRLEAMLAIVKPRLEEFGPGDCESTLIWQEPSGIWGRCRPDFLAEDRKVVVDYKTATCADPLVWIKRVLMNSRYDLQGGWNLRGLDHLVGKTDRDFIFLVQEITPPYCVSVIGLGPELLDLAKRKIEAGLFRWKKAIDSGEWPGYDTRTHWAEMPTWALYDWENREAAHQGAKAAASVAGFAQDRARANGTQSEQELSALGYELAGLDQVES